MQRFRIGLTGLAAVFVVVLLAAVFSSPNDEPTITANTIEQVRTGQSPSPPASKEPTEPLAELGVVPGAADVNAAAPLASDPAR